MNAEYKRGLLISELLSKILIMPLPLGSFAKKSATLMAGSPKNSSPPSDSKATIALTIVAIEVGAILP